MNLNFYLFRESITDFDQAINQEKAQGEIRICHILVEHIFKKINLQSQNG
jgi:hypothetical protein